MAKGGKTGCKSKASLIDREGVSKSGSSESEIDTDEDGEQGPSMPNFQGDNMKLMGKYCLSSKPQVLSRVLIISSITNRILMISS